jgi:type I restriction enzyme M protein
VEANNFVLTPGRYVGTEEVEDDGVSYEEKVAVISENLRNHLQNLLNYRKG